MDSQSRQYLKHILSQTPLWDGETEQIVVTDSTAQAMQIRVLVSAQNGSDAWDLRCLVREKMITFIQNRYPHHLPRIRI
ncbi:MAG: mechanosensitive ion channel family protein, partial [Bacteroidota bacterium]